MKRDDGTPSLPPKSHGGVVVADGENRKTVSDVIESLGVTGHHHHIIIICSLVWFLSGWATTIVTFLLDAAGQKNSSWVETTSAAERLTLDDRSYALLVAGLLSALCCPVLGNLSDFAGRIPLMQAGVVISAFVTIGYALVHAKLVLIPLVVLSQLDVSVLMAQSLLAEWVPVHLRGFLLCALNACWNLGRLGITVLWVFFPPAEYWKSFFLIAAVPSLILSIFLVARGQRYESPPWLAMRGNTERCIEVLRLASETAPKESRQLPEGWDNPTNFQLESESGQLVHVEQRSKLVQIGELFESRLQCNVLVLGFCLFTVNFSWAALFYWVFQYLRMIGAENAIIPVMLAAPVGKIFSVVLMIMPCTPGRCAIDRFSRKAFMEIGFCGAGLCMALFCGTTNVIALAAIMFASQVFEGCIWQASTVYVAEAFPTTVRNAATGLTWMFGALGGIVSATIAGKLMEIWVYLPMVIGSTGLFAGCAACFLLADERKGCALIDTMGYGACDGRPV